MRLRSRITCCDCSLFVQKLVSLAFFTTSASCSRKRGASKILPQIVDLGAYDRVFAFEILKHEFAFPGLHKSYWRSRIRPLNAALTKASIEIIAQPPANQSP